MKGLTLLNPWAYLMAMGHKKWETRNWQPTTRGEVAITSSKAFTDAYKAVCLEKSFREVIAPNVSDGDFIYAVNSMPCGSVMCVGQLVEVITSEEWLARHKAGQAGYTDQEKAFGNYEPRRFAWRFENMILLPKMIPCRGKMSIWDLPGSIEAQVREQMQKYEQIKAATAKA